jgi:hypothetical protein
VDVVACVVGVLFIDEVYLLPRRDSRGRRRDAWAIRQSAVLTLSQSPERSPRRYGESTRLATMPSTSRCSQAVSTSATLPHNRGVVHPAGPFSASPSSNARPPCVRLADHGTIEGQHVERDERQRYGPPSARDPGQQAVEVARAASPGDEFSVQHHSPAHNMGERRQLRTRSVSSSPRRVHTRTCRRHDHPPSVKLGFEQPSAGGRPAPRLATDGRPDPRVTVRENVKILGDLTSDFDFAQPPRPPETLLVHPRSTVTRSPEALRAHLGHGNVDRVRARPVAPASSLPHSRWRAARVARAHDTVASYTAE